MDKELYGQVINLFQVILAKLRHLVSLGSTLEEQEKAFKANCKVIRLINDIFFCRELSLFSNCRQS